MDMESSHSALQELHYSLASSMRLQSHHLYYQTSNGERFDLVDTESFDLKVQLSAAPDVHVVASGSIDTFAIKMVRPEITDGLRQIFRQLRLNVEPKKRVASKTLRNQNFLRGMPDWLLQFQMQATDVSLEVAGIDEEISEDTRGVSLQLDSFTSEYRAQRLDGLQRRPSRRRANSRTVAPDADLLKTPLSPRKKQQNAGDGRRTDPFGFKRAVQKTSAMLRYDKYNTLRLKYNDEVNTAEGSNPSSQPSTESRVDNLWVEF
ncbi:hypothetical protein BN1723_018690, partial [Verticillium longisporum]